MATGRGQQAFVKGRRPGDRNAKFSGRRLAGEATHDQRQFPLDKGSFQPDDADRH